MEKNCPFCKKTIEGEPHDCPHCGSLIGKGAFEYKDIQPGEILSERYKIIKTLGRGGMGTVYLAEETTLATGRYVAIKLLPASMTTDKSILSRFQDEIKTAAMLDHQNIVPIYFVGEHLGLYFFVMKYLEGGTIYQLVKKLGSFSEKETRRILALICDALDFAHMKGVVHRDIKASNIMISPDGVPTLMDFGVARSGETSEITMPGQIVGTAEYMAPEQWYGEAEAKSDIYSLGVVMYYMLTGNLPFLSKNTFELMKMHQESIPASIRSQKGEVTPEMEAICSWCLEKEKGKRPSRSSVLASSLRQEQDIISDPGVAPVGYQGDFDSDDKNPSTMDYNIPSDSLPLSITREDAEKFDQYILQAENEYANGHLKRAVKMANKAAKINRNSTKLEYSLKKYEHLLKTINEIIKQTEIKIKAGFINQAKTDYQSVLNVYDIPDIRLRLENISALVDRIGKRFAEGKKLQLQGKYDKAFKCFSEVVKYDSENADALERKKDLHNKLKRKKVRKKKKEKKVSKTLKRISIPLAIFIILLFIIFSIPTILQKGSVGLYKKGKYSSPFLLNTYTFYRIMDVISGPDKEREKIIQQMIEELVSKGNIARGKNDLSTAINCYEDALKMIPHHSTDREKLEILIEKLNLQLKLK